MLPTPRRLAAAASASALRALVAVSLLAVASVASAEKPNVVAWNGHAVSSDGAPLSGSHRLTLRYVDEAGETLVSESFAGVAVADGRFSVQLGAGKVAATERYDSVQAAFADHPSLKFELAVDGVAQAPLIGVLPAGHSIESRAVAAGVDADGKGHWKHYKAKGGVTSLQAGTLAPATTAEPLPSTPTLRRRPYVVPMRGPMVSAAVRDLPGGRQRQRPPHREAIKP
ncbi:MAG: hypothetical protein AAGD86_06580, partial [Pseudomonadota bacterium]